MRFFDFLFFVDYLALPFPIRIRIHSGSETLTVATVSFLTGQKKASEIKVQPRS
jgi:hypothetical protein